MIRSLGLALPCRLVPAAPVLVASAQAAPKRGNADRKRFCAGDAATVCGDVDSDSDRMDACFAAHRQALSKACRTAIDACQAAGGQ